MAELLHWTETRSNSLLAQPQSQKWILWGAVGLTAILSVAAIIMKSWSPMILAGVVISGTLLTFQQLRAESKIGSRRISITTEGVIVGDFSLPFSELTGFSVRPYGNGSELTLVQKSHSTPLIVVSPLTPLQIERALEPDLPLLESGPPGRLDPFLSRIRL